MEQQKEIQKLYQTYDLLLEANIGILWSLSAIQDSFQDILDSLDEVVTRDELESLDKRLESTEKDFCDIKEKIHRLVVSEDVSLYNTFTSEVEDDRWEVSKQRKEKMEVIDKQEKVVLGSKKQYDEIKKQTFEIAEQVKIHKSKLRDYINKIHQIRAREIMVYRSSVVNKTVRFAGSFVRRSVEAKLLSTVVPKKMAQLYLATKVVRDAKKLIQEEDFSIVRKEAEVSYYDEIKFEHMGMKNYEIMVKESLADLRSLKEEYEKVCKGFPNDKVFKDNMKRLEELEDVLLQEAMDVENVIDDYNQTLDYNEQKVKSLRE